MSSPYRAIPAVVGDHGVVTMRRALPVLSPGVLVALLVVLAGMVAARPAQAAACSATVHVQGTVVLVELDPSAVTVRQKDCVVFVNDLSVPVDVHVDPGFDRQVPPGGRVSYSAVRVGKHDMSAGTLVFTDTGTVTGRRAAPPPTSSAPTTAPPSSSSPPSSSRSPQPSGDGSGGPRVAPTPSFTGFPTPSLSSPPGTPPSVASVTPYPTAPVPTASSTAAVAGPIEPASGRGAGLPAAVAALAVVGAGAGLVRVLLAEPVDDRRSVGGTA
jgi:hypothetical protein